MDWNHRVRTEYEKLRHERKIQVSNAWNENRALIQDANDTMALGHCVFNVDYNDPKKLSRGKLVGGTGYTENEVTTQIIRTRILPVDKPPSQLPIWFSIPRNMPDIESTEMSLSNPGGKAVDNEYVANSDVNESVASSDVSEDDGSCDMDDDIFIKLVEALIPYQRNAQVNSSSQDNNETVIVNGTLATSEVPEAIIFQSIHECFPGKTDAAHLQEKYQKLTKKTLCTPNVDEPMERVLTCDEALDSYKKYFCPKCFIYCCPFHSHENNFVPKRRNNETNSMKPSDRPCSKSCYLLKNVHRENGSERKKTGNGKAVGNLASRRNNFNIRAIENAASTKTEWSNSDLTMLNVVMSSFPGNFCVIAKVLRSKTCQEVHEQCKLLPISDIKISKNPAPKKDTKRGYNLQGFEQVIRPCNHEGTCGSKRNNNGNSDESNDSNNGTVCLCINCEKFCNCDADCKKRTRTTCNCKAVCSTPACNCYNLGRECDPDICGCGSCKNKNIQNGRTSEKKLHVAASTIHGQGLFASESCKKGDYIIEYRGELITMDESYERAKDYGADECTYMFQLNDEYVLDAMKFGNRARFINFSYNPNCHSKVLIVNGDHRVGIFAKRSIQAGEELTLNYLTDDPTKSSNSRCQTTQST